MSSMWKALVVLVLALPVGAYVAGSLMDGRAALPERRPLVVVDDPAEVFGSTAADPQPSLATQDPEDDDADDIEIVHPDPEDVAEELEDAAEDRREAREDLRDELEDARKDADGDDDGSGDDNSGRGGGDDGSGGDDG